MVDEDDDEEVFWLADLGDDILFVIHRILTMINCIVWEACPGLLYFLDK